ncbi:hypothetical protein [Erythrobacter colymbi]|uniref:hypothetical protein n=1 Tax=Erythrobacter colymbi TaxID=1161202 RepID=UPI00117F96D3|nr:hypothetical protein [Erythrobacter colymbi]
MIEAPETPHTHHHGHGHGGGSGRWFDIAMAVAVLLVSAGSLYVALHTGHTMEALVRENERLVRAQSTPVLQYDHGNISDAGEPQLEFTVTNVGTGPARIVWFRISHEGKSFSSVGSWARSTGKGSITFTSSSINRIVLAPNDKRRMVSWARPADAPGLARWKTIDRERFNATVEACYCSVFDQCWQSSLEADIPREVNSCAAPDGEARTEPLDS